MQKGGITPAKIGKSERNTPKITLGEASKSQNTPLRNNFYNQ